MTPRLRSARNTVAYWAVRGFFAIGGRLPLTTLRHLGGWLGAAALKMSHRERERALEHVAVAFPDLDGEQRAELIRRCAAHLGQTLSEVAWLWRARADQVAELCSMDGAEHLHQAREEGRGAVLITAHCGNWELLNARLGAAGIPMTIAVRELDDPRLSDLATRLREHCGAEVVPRGAAAGRRLARALVSNRVNGLLIDQDIRDVPGVFVPFFGRPAWTPSGAATLALRAGCPVVPAFIHRQPDGRHIAQVHPPLPLPTTGSDEDQVHELTAAATAAIERQIRAHPEQWVWMHRRWRTQPE
jgi:KDO2-lipid IV(A) lauroyltransferase